MEAATHEHHDHHDHHSPATGGALNSVAVSATLHCLTGCAIGEVLGMIIGTALGWSDWGTIALAVALAFLFGYGLTSLPLLRAGLAFAAVVPIALASDTLSIAIMEIVDNAIMLAIPGAMEAGVGSLLFWGSLSVALVIAGFAAFPVNRWLITRGRGHAVVHETGIHGGPPTRLVATVAAIAAVFGTVVLVAEAVDGGGGGTEGHGVAGGGHGAAQEGSNQRGENMRAENEQQAVRGLAVSEDGMKLELEPAELPPGRETELRFRVRGADGRPVRDFEVEHDKQMHLIVVRRDATGFQHLHPELGDDGVWSTRLTVPEPGSYRVFADFKLGGENHTLAADLAVDGDVDWQPLPAAATSARTSAGYEVRVEGHESRAGREAELRFTVLRDGRPVAAEPYLGARGHLVALREGDLAYLHVHPVGDGQGQAAGHGQAGGHGEAAGEEGPVAFATEFPSEGRYRLFLQFKHEGRVHTAAFTREVSRVSAGPGLPESTHG